MALVFPTSPTDGQLYPFPAQSGTGQWRWVQAAQTWVQIPFFLRVQEGAYNSYFLPSTEGADLSQLTSDGTGTLDWISEQIEYQNLGLGSIITPGQTTYTLVKFQSSPAVPFAPEPPSNISCYLDGALLTPSIDYTISGTAIIFTTPPSVGQVFIATSVVRNPDSPTPPPPTPVINVTAVLFNLYNPDNLAGPPCAGGYNITPTVSWSVATSGITTGVRYNLIMEDLNAGNAVHWNLTGIAGSTVNAGSIGGATIIANDFPACSNGQGYAGPGVGPGVTHNYRITITPVLTGAIITPNSRTVSFTG